jgi:hypothetical protein
MKLNNLVEAKYHLQGYDEKVYREAIRALAEQCFYMAKDDYDKDEYDIWDIIDVAKEYATDAGSDVDDAITRLAGKQPKKRPSRDEPRRVRTIDDYETE